MSFGEVPGVNVGTIFPSRRALHDAGVHGGLITGIGRDGESIVLSGGYEDDEDLGDVVIYTGQGGRHASSGRQIADQVQEGGIEKLMEAMTRGEPIRVTRGSRLDSPFAPSSGYRYDGLFRIEDAWAERPASHGFKVFRFRLVRITTEGAESADVLGGAGAPPAAGPNRVRVIVSRVIRDTAIGKRVKKLYNYECQFCGTVLHVPGGRYAECCHIRPLGRPHNGPDELSNVLCLCPNCHLRFDYYALRLSEELLILPEGRRLNLVPSHSLSMECERFRELIATLEE